MTETLAPAQDSGVRLNGTLQPIALLRKVIRPGEEPELDIRAYGNPNDQGWDVALIGPNVNGALDLQLGHYRLEPEQYHPRHYHPFGAEFYYVLEGTCLITVDDDVIEASPGFTFYLPARTVHAVRTRPGETARLLYGYDRNGVGAVWLE